MLEPSFIDKFQTETLEDNGPVMGNVDRGVDFTPNTVAASGEVAGPDIFDTVKL